MSESSSKNNQVKEIDKEVLVRLPFWVRELLAMVEEAEKVKAKPRVPSAFSSEAP